MGTIFISHSSLDNELAGEIVERLKQAGHTSVFLDFHPEDGIPAGRNWEQELYRRLRMCRAVIVLCTEHSMASKWCFAEIAHARALGKPVIPIKADECEIDDLLKDRQILDLALNAEEAFDRLLKALEERGLDAEGSFTWNPKRPPYPGLLAFQESEAATFFGRDDAIRDGLAIANRLRNLSGANLLLVLGASGSGKSSLVRAGLLPRLRRDREHWIVVDPFRPLGDFLGELSAALTAAFQKSGVAEDSDSRLSPLSSLLWDEAEQLNHELLGIARNLRHASNAPDARIVLVVDQAEELLAEGASGNSSVRLFRALCECNAFLVVATLRSDYLGVFQGHANLRGLDFETLPLGPISFSGLRQAIAGPAAMAGMELESSLVDTLVEEAGEFDALPLLAFTLRELWERQDPSGKITLRVYRHEIGGIAGAIAKRAEECLASAAASQEHLGAFRQAMLQMVRINEEGEYARRTLRWEDAPVDSHALLQRFVEERLLVSHGDGDTSVLEVTHEALFRAWSRLSEWLAENVEQLRIRARIELAEKRWTSQNEHVDFLLPKGRALEEARDFFHSSHTGLEERHLRFIAFSVKLRDSEAETARNAESKRRRRAVQLLGALGLLVVVGSMAIYAFSQKSLAEQQQQGAELATQRAETAQGTAETAQGLTETYRLAYSSMATQARDAAGSPQALEQALEANVREILEGRIPPPEARRALGEAVSAFERSRRFGGHLDGAEHCQFSPDGARIVTLDGSGLIYIWDVKTGLKQLTLDAGNAREAVFSPDGRTILSSRSDGATIWDAWSGEKLFVLEDPEWEGRGRASFSKDGKYVLTDVGTILRRGGAIRVWDVSTGALMSTLAGIDGKHLVPRFSPDGTKVVVAVFQGFNLSIYDSISGALLADYPTSGPLYDFAVFPDGQEIAVSYEGGDIGIMSMETGEKRKLLSYPGDSSSYIELSPQGKRLISIDKNGVALVWDTEAGEIISEIRGHFESIRGVCFSPDGEFVLSASWDGRAKMWNATTGDEYFSMRHSGAVGWAEFSPDGLSIATLSEGDDQLRLWTAFSGERNELLSAADYGLLDSGGISLIQSDYNLSGNWGSQVMTLSGAKAGCNTVAFSPGGDRVLSVSLDHSARVWNALTGKEECVLVGFDGDIEDALFSQSGDEVVTVANNGVVNVWGAELAELRSTFPGRGESVQATLSKETFSLATRTEDGLVRVIDLASAVEVFSFQAAGGYGIKFLSAGRAIAIEDEWETWVFDVGTGKQENKIEKNVRHKSLSFSPGGETYLCVDDDENISIRNTATGLTTLALEKVSLPFGGIGGWEQMEYSVDGNYVIGGYEDFSRLNVWEAETGNLKYSLELFGGSTFNGWRFMSSPDGVMLATINSDSDSSSLVEIWDLATGKKLHSLVGHSGPLNAICFSPDSQFLASASMDKTARVWNISFQDTLNRAWQMILDRERLSVPVRRWLEANTSSPSLKQRQTWFNMPPLHVVAISNNILAATALLEGAEPLWRRDDEGRQALHVAAIYGSREVAALLLEHGADFMAKGQDGKTPLDLAREHKHQALIDLLESAQQSPK